MAGDRLNDGPDVVIRPGPSAPSGGGGFFGIGGGGGFGGGFGGSSKRRRKKRAEARAIALAKAQADERARRAAAAKAQAAARALEHQQRVDGYGQARESRRALLDQNFADRSQALAQALNAQVLAARTPPASDHSERWQLYMLTKARREIDGLIERKRAELARQQGLAQGFADQGMAAEAYTARLASLGSDAQMRQLHQHWDAAYAADQEARLLQQAIEQLSQRSTELLLEHGRQQEVWRGREAELERQRQYAEQRETRIRFKQRADEDRRSERLRQAATLTAPLSAAQVGVLFTHSGAQVAAEAAMAIERAVVSAGKELLRIALQRTTPLLILRAAPFLYSSSLGDGELGAEQRQRHLLGLGVGAQALGLADGQDLQALADAEGAASVAHRIRIEHIAQGSVVVVAATGTGIAAQVPVRNAVLDPLTGTYRVEARDVNGKTLVLANSAAALGSPPSGGQLLMLEPQVGELPAGADLRFDDCIVCVPGLAPQYFSFAVAPAGTGVVTGKGQPAGAQWWTPGNAQAGIDLPAQVGDQLRGRTFTSQPAFEAAVWRAIAADVGLSGQFDEVNQRRLLNGYAPVAAKAEWHGERRNFELRHLADPGVGAQLYDLDQLRVHTPSSTQGVRSVVQPFAPWFASSVELGFDPVIAAGQPPRTWTPLVAPGADFLGSTVLPQAPSLPGVYPGGATDPVVPDPEIHPGENPDETRAIIPGFGGEEGLPSPGLVNHEPAKPLEVGEYKDLSRRSINDLMDVDHIVSRKALEHRLKEIYSGSVVNPAHLKGMLDTAPSIVIPAEVHRKYSQTYGGRNSLEQQLKDASDLRAAVNANVDALKSGLLDYGFSESDIESARLSLHELHSAKGHYQ